MAKLNDKNNPGALFVPAGLLAGIGLGFLTGNIWGYLFIGLGVGFVAFAIVSMVYKEK